MKSGVNPNLYLLARHYQVSMSQVSNCYDHAMIESFFSTLKAGCVTGQFANRGQARRAFFEYLEVCCNRQ